jgi:hypothetical protein
MIAAQGALAEVLQKTIARVESASLGQRKDSSGKLIPERYDVSICVDCDRGEMVAIQRWLDYHGVALSFDSVAL